MVLTMSVIKNEHQGNACILQKQTHTPAEFTMLQCSSCGYPKTLILLPTSTEIIVFISASPLLPCVPASCQPRPSFRLSKLQKHKTWKPKTTKPSRN